MSLASLDHQFQGLNDAQRAAVYHQDGPLLVLAGAGSGKTRVVTLRIARLLLSGEAPKSILAVTFTNRAAKEMKERLVELAGKAARGVWVSTFHALCARLLRRDAHRIGLSPNFTILDEGDQRAQLLTVARALGLQLGEKEPRLVLSRIGLWKNQGFRTDRSPFTGDSAGQRLRADDVGQLADRLWIPYAGHLRALSAVDFDDLLLYARELLEQVPDVRKRYQALFRYLHIDEYQDTNPLQLDIVRLLCGPHKNLTVVGDDDQAIYGFRGADVLGILAFDQHFSPCTTVKLEQNYRSTGNILAAANAVIRRNTQRKDKTLRTSGPLGEPLAVLGLADGDAEADAVCGRIAALVKEGAKPEDIAVLYRAGPQSRPFEEGLRLRGVPYRVVGGMEFFQRKEVKDTLALMTCICRPDDELAFRRVVNLPARGLGEKAVAVFVAHVRALGSSGAGASLIDAAASAERTGLKGQQEQALRAFAAPLMAARPRVLAEAYDEDKDVADVVRRAVLAASIAAVIDGEPELEAKERWRDTVDEVCDTFAAFVDTLREARLSPDLEASAVALGEVGPDGPLAAFLDRLALDDSDDDDDDDDEREQKGRVQLMSLHASKGLEFPHVFLVGLEEGLLPHRRVLEEGGHGVEEERRLCYVGITRARRALVITHALHRRRRHELLPRRASRFLEDIPPEAQGKPPDGPADPAAAFFAAMRAREQKG